MRFAILIPGSLLLLGWMFLIGVTRTTPDPEKLYPTPKTAAAFVSRAQLYERRGNLEKALVDYTQATRLEPTNRQALLYQASTLAMLNRPAESIQKYQILRKLYQQKDDDTRLIDYSIQEQQQKLRSPQK